MRLVGHGPNHGPGHICLFIDKTEQRGPLIFIGVNNGSRPLEGCRSKAWSILASSLLLLDNARKSQNQQQINTVGLVHGAVIISAFYQTGLDTRSKTPRYIIVGISGVKVGHDLKLGPCLTTLVSGQWCSSPTRRWSNQSWEPFGLKFTFAGQCLLGAKLTVN